MKYLISYTFFVSLCDICVTLRENFEIPSEKYIQQRLDNFDAKNTHRWQMRYFENDLYFKPNGPIFIRVGGEFEILPKYIAQGTLIAEMAREMNGILFHTEHRFYGKSRPTKYLSTEDLKFLSVDQALEDLAYFIKYIKSSSVKFSNSNVILVGASYSGTMSVWMREKYPHLVQGVFASSAPIHAQIDFYQYKEVMTRSIERLGGYECTNIIRNAFIDMERLIKENNVARITKSFNLCKDFKNSYDVSSFFFQISDIIAGIIQHDSRNIEIACRILRNERYNNGRKNIEAFAALVIPKELDEDLCNDFSYESYIREYRNNEYNTKPSVYTRQWFYQTCSEFGWFQTSSSKYQIFGSNCPVNFFIKMCNDLFDNQFSEQIIANNAKRINKKYGGYQLNVTNFVFTNGDLDPWYPMSILQNLNNHSNSIIIPLTSHAAD